MSETVVSESSPYRDSIKFYERMSDLQGELKNYETQEFQLEEQFQRLWTQGINLEPSSTVSAGKGPILSSQVGLGHLTQSQLLSKSANYYGKNDELDARRRASSRNQIILDKLQEMETNASIFAARSERLRMMRSEYESLVRKYASNRKSNCSELKPSYYTHSHQSQSFSSVPQSPKTITVLTSTGVNTDITGPIMPYSTEENILPRFQDANGARRQPEKLSVNGRRESYESFKDENEPIYNKSTRPTFLDISSTSESEFTIPKLKQYSQDNFDDTSADTTSLSVLMPKLRGSSHLPKLTADLSLTDSTSLKQQPIRKSALKRNTVDAKIAAKNTEKVNRDISVGGDEERLINCAPEKSEMSGKLIQDNGEESASSSDSTSNSIGDSVMDSVQNKTPDTLPKDDSELLHITEVEEDEDVDTSDRQHYRDEDKELHNPTPTVLTNEMGGQDQETWDNLSSSNLVRVAQKEIGIRYSEEPLVFHSDAMNPQSNEKGTTMKLSENVDSKTKRPLVNRENILRNEILLKDESFFHIDAQLSEDVLQSPHMASVSSKASTSSSSSSSLNSVEKQKQKARMEKVPVEKADPPTDHELNKAREEYAKSNTTHDNFSSPIGKPKSSHPAKSFPSDSISVTGSYDQKETIQTLKTGNEVKKLRLKFDYDDTESDGSEAGLVHKESVKPLIHQQPTKLNVKDDDFDSFFD